MCCYVPGNSRHIIGPESQAHQSDKDGQKEHHAVGAEKSDSESNSVRTGDNSEDVGTGEVPSLKQGVAPGRKAHLLVDRKNRRFFTSRDVAFDEGGKSHQRVVIEDTEKSEDDAIVSYESNESKVELKTEKSHAPEPSKPE
ncbi:hypothetical protein FRC11_004339 [Ceratobasidium sp. 423]|nr:hypothetical protein FRC11_004339 [Ceratobasidium sp. 423]